jgi:hypothetical protein
MSTADPTGDSKGGVMTEEMKSLDFYEILEKEGGTRQKPLLEVYPSFRVRKSKDLMVRGKQFYAIWDEEAGLWSTDEYDVQRLVDAQVMAYEVKTPGIFEVYRKTLGNFNTNSWLTYRNYVHSIENNYHQLDSHLTFKNTETKKEDYITKRLPYDLDEGDINAWDEIVGTLYDEDERRKIEWMIGAIVAGDSKTIQKCAVFYGDPGTGKGTIINIMQWLFEGYWEAFSAKDLTGASNAFALEAFKMNPLVAFDPDGDLSRVVDNTKFNSMVSHESIQINEKNKPLYTSRFDTFLVIGSNYAIKFTDSKSGLIRRILDIHPSGRLIPPRKYQSLMNQIKFELGAIANHCHEVYQSMGKHYYAEYKPIEMMLQTDVFFNFIETHYDIFKKQDGATLKQAFDLWKLWKVDTQLDEWKMPLHKFREEFKSYFENFEERGVDKDGERVRSYFSGFKADKFKSPTGKTEPQHMFSLVMEETESLFDKEFANAPAQYGKDGGSSPRLYWDDSVRTKYDEKKGEYVEFVPEPEAIAKTKLKDLDTSKEHFVKVPENHIIIDFDLTDAEGKKSAERNLEAASTWPPTYAEFSKSGEGIHLHYNYTGDPRELASRYDDGIEVKVYTGNSSLRRRLSLCNNIPVADISSGLPLKEKKSMDVQKLQDERHIRALIGKALRKEASPGGTKTNVDFIHMILDKAYRDGMVYDVTDMQNRIFSFAALSTNQAMAAMKLVQDMKFASEARLEQAAETPDSFKSERSLNADREVLFDVEVFPNLFVICWMYKDAPRESIVTMINPSSQEVEKLLGMKLVGFNNRRYDNHILYGAYLGFDLKALYNLSQKIINNVANSLFGEAYNLSYMDLYDVATKKQGLKKWEIELGIHHLELGIPWDEPVDKSLWTKVAEYCRNDVWATNVTRNHLEPDVIARQILAELSGLPMNATTNAHTTKIIFGEDRKPQSKFKYTDLGEMFPGYKYDMGKSTYRDEITGEGGYVYAEPGLYENVAVLDVASMHPTSIEQLDLFGEYTEKFSTIKTARVAIKRKDVEKVKELLGEKISRYLTDPMMAKALSDALKIAINSVYGLTSARFENPFKDPKNIDNIVAKRGALFMIDLKHAVQEQGFQVVHIKTDSIKIPNATDEIIKFVMDFGAKYGYDFEHEETYRKMALVNDAVFIAQKSDGKWSATGAQFAHPYVFKRLFSHEPIVFEDMCETKAVQTSLFLDYTGLNDTPGTVASNLNDSNMKFVGKVGEFCPMEPGTGGGILLREKDGKFYAATGTKGWFWLEAEMVQTLKLENNIEIKYFERLVDDAIDTIKKFTTDIRTFEWFVGADKELAQAA